MQCNLQEHLLVTAPLPEHVGGQTPSPLAYNASAAAEQPQKVQQQQRGSCALEVVPWQPKQPLQGELAELWRPALCLDMLVTLLSDD